MCTVNACALQLLPFCSVVRMNEERKSNRKLERGRLDPSTKSGKHDQSSDGRKVRPNLLECGRHEYHLKRRKARREQRRRKARLRFRMKEGRGP